MSNNSEQTTRAIRIGLSNQNFEDLVHLIKEEGYFFKILRIESSKRKNSIIGLRIGEFDITGKTRAFLSIVGSNINITRLLNIANSYFAREHGTFETIKLEGLKRNPVELDSFIKKGGQIKIDSYEGMIEVELKRDYDISLKVTDVNISEALRQATLMLIEELNKKKRD